MARNYPISKDTWPAASAYSTGSPSWSALDMVHWMENAGDQFETIEDWLGYYTDTAADVTISGRMLAVELGTRMARTSYTPTLNPNGLTTTTSTWTGNYFKPASGKIGLVSVTGKVTGVWAGSGFISISLPSGWTAQATHEAAVITGWAAPFVAPFGAVGVHSPLIGVVHPGDTEIRVIAPAPNSGTTNVGFCTATASSDLFSCGNIHNLSADDLVRFSAADATGVPAGITAGTNYWVIASGLTTTAFKVSATRGGSTINVTADGNVSVERRDTNWWLAADGVNTPFHFSGSGTATDQDEIHLTGFVLLA